MADTVQVRRTEKKIAFELEVGDVIAASLLDDEISFRVSLYTVTQVWPHSPGDETMTVELAYDYKHTEPGTRTMGIRRMDFVTVV